MKPNRTGPSHHAVRRGAFGVLVSLCGCGDATGAHANVEDATAATTDDDPTQSETSSPATSEGDVGTGTSTNADTTATASTTSASSTSDGTDTHATTESGGSSDSTGGGPAASLACLDGRLLGVSPSLVDDLLLPTDGGYHHFWTNVGGAGRATLSDGVYAQDFAVSLGLGIVWDTTFSDFDGDGLVDVFKRPEYGDPLEAYIHFGTNDPLDFADDGVDVSFDIALARTVVADFDGDGASDILGWHEASATLELWLWDPGGDGFVLGASTPAPADTTFVHGRRAEDDPQTVVIAYSLTFPNNTTRVIVYSVSGAEIVERAQGEGFLLRPIIRAADDDGDGEPEIFTGYESTSSVFAVDYLHNDGNGSISVAETMPAGVGYYARDFDGDGDGDVMIWDADGGTFSVRENVDGTLMPPAAFVPTEAPTAEAPTYGATLDIDGDGQDEVLLNEDVGGSNDRNLYVFDAGC